jgi:hypothetical protein
MKKSGAPFSTEEHEEIMRLYARGMLPKQIGEVVGRTAQAISSHVSWFGKTPQEKKDAKDRKNMLRRMRDANRRSQKMHVSKDGVGSAGNRSSTVDSRPPADVLADRDRRASRPFDIRLDILGDPESGRSALDQLRAREPA